MAQRDMSETVAVPAISSVERVAAVHDVARHVTVASASGLICANSFHSVSSRPGRRRPPPRSWSGILQLGVHPLGVLVGGPDRTTTTGRRADDDRGDVEGRRVGMSSELGLNAAPGARTVAPWKGRRAAPAEIHVRPGAHVDLVDLSEERQSLVGAELARAGMTPDVLGRQPPRNRARRAGTWPRSGVVPEASAAGSVACTVSHTSGHRLMKRYWWPGTRSQNLDSSCVGKSVTTTSRPRSPAQRLPQLSSRWRLDPKDQPVGVERVSTRSLAQTPGSTQLDGFAAGANSCSDGPIGRRTTGTVDLPATRAGRSGAGEPVDAAST